MKWRMLEDKCFFFCVLKRKPDTARTIDKTYNETCFNFSDMLDIFRFQNSRVAYLWRMVCTEVH